MCVWVCVCLSVFVSFCLSLCLSFSLYLVMSPSVSLFISLCVCLSVYVSLSLSLSLSLNLWTGESCRFAFDLRILSKSSILRIRLVKRNRRDNPLPRRRAESESWVSFLRRDNNLRSQCKGKNVHDCVCASGACIYDNLRSGCKGKNMHACVCTSGAFETNIMEHSYRTKRLLENKLCQILITF